MGWSKRKHALGTYIPRDRNLWRPPGVGVGEGGEREINHLRRFLIFRGILKVNRRSRDSLLRRRT